MMLSVFFFRPILLRNLLQQSGTTNKGTVYLTDGNGSEHRLEGKCVPAKLNGVKMDGDFI